MTSSQTMEKINESVISSGASEVAKQPSFASSSEARRSVAP